MAIFILQFKEIEASSILLSMACTDKPSIFSRFACLTFNLLLVLYHPFFGGKKPVAPKKPPGACEAGPSFLPYTILEPPAAPGPPFPCPSTKKQTAKIPPMFP